jgi:[citrate (pro-3S)-lyase] ligase
MKNKPKKYMKILASVMIMFSFLLLGAALPIKTQSADKVDFELLWTRQGGEYQNYAARLASFEPEILEALKKFDGKKVLVHSNDAAFLKNIKELKPEYATLEKSERLDAANFGAFVVIIDTVSEPSFLSEIYGVKTAVSFLEIYEPILFDKALKFFKENNIEYFFFEAPDEKKIKNLDDFEKELLKKKWHEIAADDEKIAALYPDCEKCREYMKNYDIELRRLVSTGRYKAYADLKSERVNIQGGERVIPNAPENFSNKVYCFGPCTTFGSLVCDDCAIPSFIQANLSARPGNSYAAANCGASYVDNINDFEIMLGKTYKPGDIIVQISYACPTLQKALRENGVKIMATSKLFDRPHDIGYWMLDKALHLNGAGNKAIADYVTRAISKKLKIVYPGPLPDQYCPTVSFRAYSLTSQNPDFERYLRELRQIKQDGRRSGKIGAIVMNCNPFTLGHKHLIEEALKHVSHLYVFVVEEDKSAFSFADRIELVRAGTREFKNVTVLPSGKYIISVKTLPDYFRKEEIQDVAIDPSLDVELFGNHIAKALGITARFVGEEPLDKITRQYNQAMREKLPMFGIEFFEIPRKEIDGRVISASTVRKLLAEKNWVELKKYVPETTYKFLARETN